MHCFSYTSLRYERRLESGAYGTVYGSPHQDGCIDLFAWAGDNRFCSLCFESAAYVNFYHREHRTPHLHAYEQAYLDRIGSLYDSVE